MVVKFPSPGEILGLTDYEHRAYCALLAEPESTAYRIGRVSGVPLSKVYDVMDRLVAKGAAHAFGAKPTRYRPTDPDEMVSRAREDLEGQLMATGAALTALYSPVPKPEDEVFEGAEALASAMRTRATAAEVNVRCVCGSQAEPFVRRSLPPRCVARISIVSLSPALLSADAFLVAFDDQAALIGSVKGGHTGQVSHRETLVAMAHALYTLAPGAPGARALTLQSLPAPDGAGEWLGYEEAKHRRLLRPH